MSPSMGQKIQISDFLYSNTPTPNKLNNTPAFTLHFACTAAQGVMPRKEDDDGGRFLVLSKDEGGAEFDYRQAQYGPGVVETSGGGPEGIAVAEPFDGCDDKAYKVLRSTLHAVGVCWKFSVYTKHRSVSQPAQRYYYDRDAVGIEPLDVSDDYTIRQMHEISSTNKRKRGSCRV